MPGLSVIQALVDLLQPYRVAVYTLFFVGFFVATLVAFVLHRVRFVRSTYVAGFFALLLVVNLAVPVHALPLVHWHKFSEPRAQELVWHEVRVVDSNDRELVYDDRATLGVDGVTMEDLQREMRTEYTHRKNCEVSRWLLERARLHRDRMTTQSPLDWLRFPPHGLNNQWTAEDLQGYDAFVGLRIYELRVVTSADGSEVNARDETKVYEYAANEPRHQVCPGGGSLDQAEEER